MNEFQYVFDQNTRQFPSLLEYCKMVGAKLVYSGSSSIFSDMKYPERLSPYTLFKSLIVIYLNHTLIGTVWTMPFVISAMCTG